jgi:hypothetical protein
MEWKIHGIMDGNGTDLMDLTLYFLASFFSSFPLITFLSDDLGLGHFFSCTPSLPLPLFTTFSLVWFYAFSLEISICSLFSHRTGRFG